MSADSQHAAWLRAIRCLPAPNDLTARTDPARNIEHIEIDGAFSEYQDRVTKRLAAESSYTALQLGLTSHGRVAANEECEAISALTDERDKLDTALQAELKQTQEWLTALAAAAKQFRMRTGDFPGLTGPLVDLFKDVK
jgi:hypothetical protein